MNPTIANDGKGTSATVKVIGAGWGRTGTSSLKKALEILGYERTYHMFEVTQHPEHADFWIRVAENKPYDFDEVFKQNAKQPGYAATCDMPSSLYWKEQLERYPDAKVVLTIRDPEKWYKSATETIFTAMSGSPHSLFGLSVLNRLGLAPLKSDFMEKVIFRGALRGQWSKEECLKTFIQHNERVKRECPHDQLLIFEVSQGWEPLCKFLGKPVPNESFPQLNDTASMQSMLQKINIFGYFVFFAITALPVALAWYAMKHL